MIGVDEGCCLFVNTGETLVIIPDDVDVLETVSGATDVGILGDVVCVVAVVVGRIEG